MIWEVTAYTHLTVESLLISSPTFINIHHSLFCYNSAWIDVSKIYSRQTLVDTLAKWLFLNRKLATALSSA